MSKRTPRNPTAVLAPARPPLLSVRTVLSVVLIAVGIAWLAVYTASNPSWMSGIGRWNDFIGFALILLGLAVAAHPSTPLGRGQGVVVGMLFCFLFGLLWILVYYVLGEHLLDVPLMRDLGNYNLVVGVGFMAVGFTYATHWE